MYTISYQRTRHCCSYVVCFYRPVCTTQHSNRPLAHQLIAFPSSFAGGGEFPKSKSIQTKITCAIIGRYKKACIFMFIVSSTLPGNAF